MEQPNGNAENAYNNKPEPDHQNVVVSGNNSSTKYKESPTEKVNDVKSMAMDTNNKMRKSVHWNEDLVLESELHSPSQEMPSSSSLHVGAKSNPYVAYAPAPSDSPPVMFKS